MSTRTREVRVARAGENLKMEEVLTSIHVVLGAFGFAGFNAFTLNEPWFLFFFAFFAFFSRLDYVLKELKYASFLGVLGLVLGTLGVVGMIPV